MLFFKAILKWIQNHSCNPNCRLYPCYINEGNIQKPLLVVFSNRDIDPDEEICFNYQGIYPGDDDDDDETEVHEDDEKPKDNIYKKCLCGTKDCKGIVTLFFCFDWTLKLIPFRYHVQMTMLAICTLHVFFQAHRDYI